MFRPSYKLIFVCLAGLFVLWAVAAALGLFGQRKLFYEGGREELYDFWMPRMCLEQGYVGHPEQYEGFVDVRNRKPIVVDDRDVVWSDWYTNGERTLFVTGWRDKVYPVISLLPFKLFPATRFGGYLWSAIAGAVMLLSLCMIAKSWQPILLALSMPFIFNIERGNPVWISAACVGVFLAWWNDEKEWKRLVAAACLAVAGTMKIAPFALGLVYFTKWRWRPVLLCGILSLVLMFVPWAFCRDGFAALPVMIKNATLHAQFVQRASDFGLVQLWRTVRIVLGQDVHEVWPGMKLVAVTSQLIGAAALIYGVCRRDKLLMVGGMLWAAGNMYYYAMLYMLPVFVLEWIVGEKGAGDRSWSSELELESGGGDFSWSQGLVMVEALLWLALLSPVQLVLLGHSANQVIGNLSLLGLMLLRTGRRVGESVLRGQESGVRGQELGVACAQSAS